MTIEELMLKANVLFKKAIASRLNIPSVQYNESTEKQQMVDRFFDGVTSIARHNEDNKEIFNDIHSLHYNGQELDPDLVAFIQKQIHFSRLKFSNEITAFAKMVQMIQQDVDPATIWAAIQPMVSIGETEQLKEQLKERIRERIEKRLQRAKTEKHLADFNTRANSFQILDCVNAFAEEGHIVKAADKVFELHKDDPEIAETWDETVAGIYNMVGQFPLEVSILQDFYQMCAKSTDPYEIVATMQLRLLEGQ